MYLNEIEFRDFSHSSYVQLDSTDIHTVKQLLINSGLPSKALKSNAHQSKDNFKKLALDQINLASSFPALGVAMAMHYHVVIVCEKFSENFPFWTENKSDIIENNKLFGSAFAEGIPSMDIFSPSVEISQLTDNNYQINGVKKPCTLSNIADYFLVSGFDKKEEMLRLSIIDNTQVITKNNQFWKSPIFAASDTQAIHINNLLLNNQRIAVFGPNQLEPTLCYGLSVFTLLVTMTYLGIFNSLTKLCKAHIKKSPSFIREMLQIEQSISTLTEVMIEKSFQSDVQIEMCNDVLVIRYQIEKLIDQGVALLKQWLGMLPLVQEPDIQHLMNCLQLFKYHPTSEFQYFSALAEESVNNE